MSFKITTFMLPAAVLAAVMAVPVAVDAQRGRGQAGCRCALKRWIRTATASSQRSEWRGNDRSFANHDWNGDGQLSGNEVRVGRAAQQELGRGRPRAESV